MRRFPKILLRLLGIFLALAVVGWLAISFIVSSLLDRDTVVGWLQEEYNMRVDLRELNVSLLGGSIDLSGLMISPRDKHADAGTPVASRPQSAGSQTRIMVRNMSVKVGLLNLLRKKLVINGVVVDGMEVSFLIERDGSPSLEPLFEKPEIVRGKANPKLAKVIVGQGGADPLGKQIALGDTGKPIEMDGFNISDIPLATSMDSLQIRNGVLYIKIRKNKNRIRVSDIQATLSSLDIDPENLTHHNSAHLEMDAKIDVMDRDRVVYYARMAVGTKGGIEPFDGETGLLNPDLAINMTLKKGSEIMSLPIIDRLTSALEKLRKAGLDVSDLEEVLVVDDDASVRISLLDGDIRTRAPWHIGLNGHQLLIEQDSWHNTGSDDHLINADLTFSSKVSDSALGRANKFLSELVGEELAVSVGEFLFSPVTREGRVYVPFVSSGDFNRPKVRPRVKLFDIKDALKGVTLGGENGNPGETLPDR
ncbi:MAG: hypothetical protein VYB61_01725 [Verrucomicrobiota bacterium]|jgi:hypothetical protein|nr:hypothetical protein [Verrucomicrobiota bacterium]